MQKHCVRARPVHLLARWHLLLLAIELQRTWPPAGTGGDQDVDGPWQSAIWHACTDRPDKAEPGAWMSDDS
jgi:hypothetical protein